MEEDHDIIILSDDEYNGVKKPCGNGRSAATYLTSIKTFYCNKCGCKFDDFWNLYDHVFKSEDHLFKCCKCDANVGYTIGEVINHVKDSCGWQLFNLSEEKLAFISSSLKYFCDKCGEGFKTFKTLRDHYVDHKVELINCIRCAFKARSVQSLMFHIKQHFITGNVELDCQVCSLRFYASLPYQLHYFFVHSQLNNIPFKCCLCSVVIIDNEEKFVWHLQTHSYLLKRSHSVRKTTETEIIDKLIKKRPIRNVSGITCEICARIFSTTESCKNHRTKFHFLQVSDNLRKECPICSYWIKLKDISVHLRDHYRRDNHIKPHVSSDTQVSLLKQQANPLLEVIEETETRALNKATISELLSRSRPLSNTKITSREKKTLETLTNTKTPLCISNIQTDLPKSDSSLSPRNTKTPLVKIPLAVHQNRQFTDSGSLEISGSDQSSPLKIKKLVKQEPLLNLSAQLETYINTNASLSKQVPLINETITSIPINKTAANSCIMLQKDNDCNEILKSPSTVSINPWLSHSTDQPGRLPIIKVKIKTELYGDSPERNDPWGPAIVEDSNRPLVDEKTSSKKDIFDYLPTSKSSYSDVQPSSKEQNISNYLPVPKKNMFIHQQSSGGKNQLSPLDTISSPEMEENYLDDFLPLSHQSKSLRDDSTYKSSPSVKTPKYPSYGISISETEENYLFANRSANDQSRNSKIADSLLISSALTRGSDIQSLPYKSSPDRYSSLEIEENYLDVNLSSTLEARSTQNFIHSKSSSSLPLSVANKISVTKPSEPLKSRHAKFLQPTIQDSFFDSNTASNRSIGNFLFPCVERYHVDKFQVSPQIVHSSPEVEESYLEAPPPPVLQAESSAMFKSCSNREMSTSQVLPVPVVDQLSNERPFAFQKELKSLQNRVASPEIKVNTLSESRYVGDLLIRQALSPPKLHKYRCPSPEDRYNMKMPNSSKNICLASSGWSSSSSERNALSRSPSPFTRELLCNPPAAPEEKLGYRISPTHTIVDSASNLHGLSPLPSVVSSFKALKPPASCYRRETPKSEQENVPGFVHQSFNSKELQHSDKHPLGTNSYTRYHSPRTEKSPHAATTSLSSSSSSSSSASENISSLSVSKKQKSQSSRGECANIILMSSSPSYSLKKQKDVSKSTFQSEFTEIDFLSHFPSPGVCDQSRKVCDKYSTFSGSEESHSLSEFKEHKRYSSKRSPDHSSSSLLDKFPFVSHSNKNKHDSSSFHSDSAKVLHTSSSPSRFDDFPPLYRTEDQQAEALPLHHKSKKHHRQSRSKKRRRQSPNMSLDFTKIRFRSPLHFGSEERHGSSKSMEPAKDHHRSTKQRSGSSSMLRGSPKVQRKSPSPSGFDEFPLFSQSETYECESPSVNRQFLKDHR